MAFKDAVRNAVRQSASEMGLGMLDSSEIDRGVDAVITDGRRQVAVQIKFFERDRVPSDAIAVLAGYASPARPVIVIGNAGLTNAAAERLRHINRPRQTIWFIRWTKDDGYTRLQHAIKQALRLG